jgi:hypothetical protein
MSSAFAHVIAQVLGFEALELFVRFDGNAGPFLMNEVGEYGELLAFLYIVCRPVIGQLIASLLAGHPLSDPSVAAAEHAPVFSGTFKRHGRVDYFSQPFLADFSEPPFEWLGTRGGDGLDEPKDSGDVPALESLWAARGFEGQEKGGDKLSPPFEGFRQERISAAKLLQIVGRVGRIGEGGDDVHDDEPPLVIMEDAADLAFFKEGHVAQRSLLWDGEDGPF